MSSELSRGEGHESRDSQSERSPPGSCVYVSPESRTLASERRSRVRRGVCLLLVLFVVLASLFVITLAISGALIVLLLYQNALATTSTTLPNAFTTVSTAMGSANDRL